MRGSFALYCVATAIIGIYNAVGLQYRFAAAEVASTADKAQGDLVGAGRRHRRRNPGARVGQAVARRPFATPFVGSFCVLALYALVALAVQSRVRVPPPTLEESSGAGRPLRAIMRQPVFIVAVLSARARLRVDEPVDDRDPARDDFCGHPFAPAAVAIQWHVVGMYAPGFFTGPLIRRLACST